MNNHYCKVKRTYPKDNNTPVCTASSNELCAPQPSGFGGALDICINCEKTN